MELSEIFEAKKYVQSNLAAIDAESQARFLDDDGVLDMAIPCG